MMLWAAKNLECHLRLRGPASDVNCHRDFFSFSSASTYSTCQTLISERLGRDCFGEHGRRLRAYPIPLRRAKGAFPGRVFPKRFESMVQWQGDKHAIMVSALNCEISPAPDDIADPH